MNQQLKKAGRQGRPPLYPTPGHKMTVHMPDEAFALINSIAQRDGVNKHFVARTALLRGLYLPASMSNE